MAHDAGSTDERLPRVWPSDLLTAAFFLLVAAVTAAGFDRVPRAPEFLVLDAGVLAALGAIIALGRRLSPRAGALWRLVHGVVAVPLVFTQVGFLVRDLRDAEYAVVLERLDRALFFGANPLEQIERIATPWLTEAMQWAYVAYLLMPPALVVLLALKSRPPEIGRACFALLGVMFLSYVGYWLVPASGPNLHNNFGPPLALGESYLRPLMPELYTFKTSLPGTWFTEALRAWMFRVEATKQDCFPSGHVAVALVVWALARRANRRIGRWFLPPALGVVLSTVYLRYHYVVDVAAGAALAWAGAGPLLRCHDALLRALRRASAAPAGGRR